MALSQASLLVGKGSTDTPNSATRREFPISWGGVTVTEGAVAPSIQRTLTRKTDTLLRDTGARLDGAATELETTLAYHATHGRLAQVTARLGGIDRYFYYMSYQYGSYDRIANFSAPAHSVTNQWMNPLGALSKKENKVGGANVSTYQYGVNGIGQRTSVDTSGGAFASADAADWQWKYNLRGELASARNNPVQPTSTASRFYEFDGIGNRLRQREGVFADTGGTLTSYTANALNQYTAVNIATPYHDYDGNMTSGPIPVSATGASLGWNGENRLASSYPWAPGSAWSACLYDALGRRAMKTVTPSGGAATRTYFIHDGWNLVAEYSGAVHTSGPPPALTLERTHAWGTDLSGSGQGAGGVGGLLATHLHNAGANSGFFREYHG